MRWSTSPTTEQPQICKSEFGVSDKELADEFGVKPNLDFNGHGGWIGGAISAATNGTGTNGLAPNVRLVTLKISQWCGSAYDSELISAFIWAADHGVDVVNISFGGFIDRSDPAQDATFKLYQDVVQYARTNGTTIVAAAGNDHVRVDTGGTCGFPRFPDHAGRRPRRSVRPLHRARRRAGLRERRGHQP